MFPGDYIICDKHGDFRIIPKQANGQDGKAYMQGTDKLVGEILESGHNPNIVLYSAPGSLDSTYVRLDRLMGMSEEGNREMD